MHSYNSFIDLVRLGQMHQAITYFQDLVDQTNKTCQAMVKEAREYYDKVNAIVSGNGY